MSLDIRGVGTTPSPPSPARGHQGTQTALAPPSCVPGPAGVWRHPGACFPVLGDPSVGTAPLHNTQPVQLVQSPISCFHSSLGLSPHLTQRLSQTLSSIPALKTQLLLPGLPFPSSRRVCLTPFTLWQLLFIGAGVQQGYKPHVDTNGALIRRLRGNGSPGLYKCFNSHRSPPKYFHVHPLWSGHKTDGSLRWSFPHCLLKYFLLPPP